MEPSRRLVWIVSLGDLCMLGINITTRLCSDITNVEELCMFAFEEITFHVCIILTYRCKGCSEQDAYLFCSLNYLEILLQTEK